MKRQWLGVITAACGLTTLLYGCAESRMAGKVFSSADNSSAPASMAPSKEGKSEFAPGGAEADSGKDASRPTLTLASMTENEPERYLIRNATVTVEVKDARQAADGLRGHLAPLKGYIGNAHETLDYTGGRTITLQIRVPSQKFDGVMQFLETLGKTLDTQVTAEDVTEEFVDTQATLRNLKRTESRLIEHLSRTGKLSDTLLVEKELNRVREEIERREGRLRFLANRVSFSTLDVTLKEAAKAQPLTPAESFSSASVASNATRSLVGFAQGVWGTLIWLGVWAVVWLPLTLFGGYLLRRVSKPMAASLRAQEPPHQAASSSVPPPR